MQLVDPCCEVPVTHMGDGKVQVHAATTFTTAINCNVSPWAGDQTEFVCNYPAAVISYLCNRSITVLNVLFVVLISFISQTTSGPSGWHSCFLSERSHIRLWPEFAVGPVFLSPSYDGPGMWHVWGEGRCIQGIVRKNPMERDLLEDTGVDRRIILKWIFVNRMGLRKMDCCGSG